MKNKDLLDLKSDLDYYITIRTTHKASCNMLDCKRCLWLNKKINMILKDINILRKRSK